MKIILSLDQGTTGTTAVLINAENFQFIDKINHEFPQIFPSPGQVEHNLEDIWNTVRNTTKEVLNKNNVTANDIVAIGITNQRETTCAFDNEGKPLANAIVWQDRRTSEYCNSFKKMGTEKKVQDKTGLPVDPYFSGSKMNWLLTRNEDVKAAASKNNLKFGTIDTYLLYKLTAGKTFATEATNASRTLLMDLATCSWDQGLCDIFEVKKEFLPEIKESFGVFGHTQGLDFLPDGIPITGILGDQQAALFGQAGIQKGDIKCTYGTGSFILLNTGTEIKKSKNGLLSTVAYSFQGTNYYALEGSCYITGASVQWLRDNLNIIESSPAIESLAASIEDLDEMKNVLFLPFFTGIGSPYWQSEATAAIVGLTRDTNKAHIARACLEGIALSINDLIEAMASDTGLKIKSLRVDGGAVANNLLMKIQATVSDLEIIRPQVIETTAYGAALGAAIGQGIFTKEQIADLWQEDQTFQVNSEWSEFYQSKKTNWKKTIQRLYL